MLTFERSSLKTPRGVPRGVSPLTTISINDQFARQLARVWDVNTKLIVSHQTPFHFRRGIAMVRFMNCCVVRQCLLKVGVLLMAVVITAMGASFAQAQSKTPKKVFDFYTYADVAKAEQEGELVLYTHDNEAGLVSLLNHFKKDFPKINTCARKLLSQ